MPGRHVLIAYNNPSAVTVHRIESDATLGQELRPAAPLDAGIYGHQIRVARSNRVAILVARGNDATNDRREDPGSLKTFRFDDGRLTSQASIAPQGGYGFGPRHLDFHPSQPWVFVSLERQNQIWVFRMDGDALHPEPLFKVDTLARPGTVQPRQLAGTIHVHPNGRFVYGANRADGTTDPGGTDPASLGENSIAVYAIDQRTGGLTPIQHVDTRGIHARTFHIDPSGRILVAAHIRPLQLREGAATRVVPASLSMFRIGADGTLGYVRKYDVEVGARSMFWMGMVGRGD
jgi:6-phosphogluconolactonase (cycloisomerase 2 family)